MWYDTSPLKGCCTATLVAVQEPERNQRLTKSPALQSAARFLYGNLLKTKRGGTGGPGNSLLRSIDNQEALAPSPIKTKRRVPQVRFLNLNLGFALSLTLPHRSPQGTGQTRPPSTIRSAVQCS